MVESTTFTPARASSAGDSQRTAPAGRSRARRGHQPAPRVVLHADTTAPAVDGPQVAEEEPAEVGQRAGRLRSVRAEGGQLAGEVLQVDGDDPGGDDARAGVLGRVDVAGQHRM